MADGSSGVKVDTAPAIGISVNVQVANNRQIALQTFVGRDDPQKLFNEVLDRIGKAVDRQVAKYTLKSLKKELYQAEKTLSDAREDTVRVTAANQEAWAESGRKGSYKLGPKEIAALANIKVSEQKFLAEIEDIKAKIKDTEAQIQDVE